MFLEPIDADDTEIAVAAIHLVGELGADKVTVADVRKHLGEDALNEHLGGLADVRSLEDDHAVPRSAWTR